jgi:hypothetical protein
MIGPRIGLKIGIRPGLAVGLGADPLSPPDEGGLDVTQDAASGLYVPIDAAEWDIVMAAAGIASGGPSSLWLLQEAASHPADSIGARTLTLNGSFSYQQDVTGMTRKGIKPGENSASDYGVIGSVNVAAESAILLGYIDSTNATDPASHRALYSLSDGTQSEGQITTGKVPRGVSGVNVAAGATAMGLTPFVVKLDRSRSELAVYTLNNKIKPTYTAPAASTAAFLGGFANSSDTTHAYLALFLGAAAELSDAQIKTLLTTLGWSPTWS